MGMNIGGNRVLSRRLLHEPVIKRMRIRLGNNYGLKRLLLLHRKFGSSISGTILNNRMAMSFYCMSDRKAVPCKTLTSVIREHSVNRSGIEGKSQELNSLQQQKIQKTTVINKYIGHGFPRGGMQIIHRTSGTDGIVRIAGKAGTVREIVGRDGEINVRFPNANIYQNSYFSSQRVAINHNKTEWSNDPKYCMKKSTNFPAKISKNKIPFTFMAPIYLNSRLVAGGVGKVEKLLLTGFSEAGGKAQNLLLTGPGGADNEKRTENRIMMGSIESISHKTERHVSKQYYSKELTGSTFRVAGNRIVTGGIGNSGRISHKPKRHASKQYFSNELPGSAFRVPEDRISKDGVGEKSKIVHKLPEVERKALDGIEPVEMEYVKQKAAQPEQINHSAEAVKPVVHPIGTAVAGLNDAEVARITERVYETIEEKLRIERQRRGIF